jgi:hypothetical protein
MDKKFRNSSITSSVEAEMSDKPGSIHIDAVDVEAD